MAFNSGDAIVPFGQVLAARPQFGEGGNPFTRSLEQGRQNAFGLQNTGLNQSFNLESQRLADQANFERLQFTGENALEQIALTTDGQRQINKDNIEARRDDTKRQALAGLLAGSSLLGGGGSAGGGDLRFAGSRLGIGPVFGGVADAFRGAGDLFGSSTGFFGSTSAATGASALRSFS
jgi:hypothetical protein